LPALCCAGQYSRTLLFNAATDEVVFSAGALVVAMPAGARADNRPQQQQQQQPLQLQQQRVFMGHSAFVSALALGGGGRLLASAQEGKQPVVRLWDCSKQDTAGQGAPGAGACAGSRCLAVLCGELGCVRKA
jgi:hypothetical protein